MGDRADVRVGHMGVAFSLTASNMIVCHSETESMTLITPAARQTPSASLRGSIHHRPLTAYFIIAFAGTWLAVLPLLLGADGLGLFSYRFGDAGILFAILSTFTGPLLAA